MSNPVTRMVQQSLRAVATGVATVVATPFVYGPLRPVTKQIVKGGVYVGRGAQSIAAASRTGWRRLVAEAEVEVHPDAEEIGEPDPLQSPDGGLTQVKGIGNDYARLLRAAGVRSVRDLAGRSPERLYESLGEVNDTKHIVGRRPAKTLVRNWIERAAAHRDEPLPASDTG